MWCKVNTPMTPNSFPNSSLGTSWVSSGAYEAPFHRWLLMEIPYSTESSNLIKFIVLGLITGTLIGTVGIGGILLAPTLTYIVGLDLHLAMAVSSFSFLFTGVAGSITYARKGTVSWRMALWLSAGIVPAAVFGARVNSLLPTTALVVILATLIAFSGVNALLKGPAANAAETSLSNLTLVLIGLGVGFGSALTGTGGPVLLVPVLLFLNIPALLAIGVSQVIQLPVAVFASIGFMLYGQIDFALGLTLGLIQAVGVLLGARLAHSLPATQLRKVVAVALIGVALFMIGRILI